MKWKEGKPQKSHAFDKEIYSPCLKKEQCVCLFANRGIKQKQRKIKTAKFPIFAQQPRPLPPLKPPKSRAAAEPPVMPCCTTASTAARLLRPERAGASSEPKLCGGCQRGCCGFSPHQGCSVTTLPAWPTSGHPRTLLPVTRACKVKNRPPAAPGPRLGDDPQQRRANRLEE